MTRNKRYRIEFAEDGQRRQYDVDALTIAIIPTDGNRVGALRPAVATLWKQFFPGEPPATGEAIDAIAAEFSATPASVVQTALAWHAGKANQSTT